MATVKLPFIRFVKRVSNGASLSKYGYIGMMDQNADAIKSAPWIAASSPSDSVTLTTNMLSKTDGVFSTETLEWTTKPTYTAYSSDIYDCYTQAGDAVARNATMCGYAGCVAYRFKLPTSETANALGEISLNIQRDRYLRSGVRVGLSLSNSETPSNDWNVVRGEATGCVRSESTTPATGVVGVSSFGFLGQPAVPYLTASRAEAGVLTLDTSTAFAEAASYQYLYLYLTVEDPSSYWNLYKATEPRQYYIEGSAMLVADNCSFSFSGSVEVSTPTEVSIGYISTSGFSPTPPIDLRVQQVSATDLTIRSTCGAPVAVINGDTTTFNLNDYVASSTVKSIGFGNPQTVGTPGIYSQFYQDKLVRCSAESAVFSIGNTAANFGVSFINTNTNNTGSEKYDTVVLIRKKVLVPFTIRSGFRPTRIRLDWRDYCEGGNEAEYYNLGSVLLRHNVWITKGDLANNYSLDTLQRHELFTAEKDTVGNFKLVGTFLHEIQGAQEGEPDFSQTFNLPYVLERGPYTILLTVFFDQDQLTFDSNGIPTQGDAYLGIMIGTDDNLILSSRNLLYFGGALPSGWSPSITLIS